MSNSVNQVFLSGTVGRDPDIRTASTGTVIASFSIATNESRKDAQGNWQENTVWSNIKCFGKLAELAREQIKKGTRVFLEGKLTVEEWADKTTGQKKSKTVIVAVYLSIQPSARNFGAGQETTPSAQNGDLKTSQQPPTAIESSLEITDADIPF